MLALQIAAAVAGLDSNADTTGLDISTHGPVLYLAAEDSEKAIWRRLHALGSRFNIATRDAHRERLVIDSLVGKRADLNDSKWQKAIIEAGEGKRLVIIDTLTRFHNLDENSNSDMSRLVSLMEWIMTECGTSMIYLHHSSKSMAISGRGDEQQAARGASALVDNARWCGYLAGMSKEEAKSFGFDEDQRGFYCRFGVSKQNYGPPLGLHWLHRGKGGILEPVKLILNVENNQNGKKGKSHVKTDY